MVVQAHHAEPAVDVKRRNASSRACGSHLNPWQEVEPRGVVVKRSGVEVENGLSHVVAQGNAERGWQRVCPKKNVLVWRQFERTLHPVHPFVACGGQLEVGLVGAVQRQGVHQGLHGKGRGREATVEVAGVAKLQIQAVRNGILSKVDIGGRQPELRGQGGTHVAKPRNVHMAHQSCAEPICGEAVLADRGELNGDGVGDGDVEQFRRRLEPKTNVGRRLGAPRKECQKASKKHIDCRVDAEVGPLHEGTKFNKNFSYSATASGFPSSIVS